MAEVKKTGSDTHVATARGYAVDTKTGAGVLVEAGDLVPAGIPVSNEWMKPVKKSDRALAGALEEGMGPQRKPVDLTQLNLSTLQTLAADRGINPGSLSKKDLILAITAADEPTL